MATARSLISWSPSVETPPDLPCPRKSKVTTPPKRFSLLTTFQTEGRCQFRVNPCASTKTRRLSPTMWTASMGTPSSVTSVSVLVTGVVMSPILRDGSDRLVPGLPRPGRLRQAYLYVPPDTYIGLISPETARKCQPGLPGIPEPSKHPPAYPGGAYAAPRPAHLRDQVGRNRGY